MEKFEKDIITVENIIKDCKFNSLKIIKFQFLALIPVLPLNCLLIYLIFIASLELKLFFGFLLFVLLLRLCVTIVLCSRNIKTLKIIKNRNFEIIIDKLIDKNETYYRNVLISPTQCLKFNEFGEYILPESISYPSAKQFTMATEELFRSSKIGDEFYLVVDDKNNILIVYNAKFFELKNDT